MTFPVLLGFDFFFPNTLISSFQCDINVSEIADKTQSNNCEEEEIQAAEGTPQLS